MTDTSGPAFPSTWSKDVVIGNEGMTKREYAAIAAMQGLLATQGAMANKDARWLSFSNEHTAKISVAVADALLRELAKEESK